MEQGYKGSNLSPHVCMVYALLTKHLPQLHISVFIKTNGPIALVKSTVYAERHIEAQLSAGTFSTWVTFGKWLAVQRAHL